MNRLFLAILLCLAALSALSTQARTLLNGAPWYDDRDVQSIEDVVWFSEGSPVNYSVQKSHDPVVDVALQMFRSDMEAVTGEKVVTESKGTITIVQLDRAKGSEISKLKKLGFDVERLRTETDAFQIKVTGQDTNKPYNPQTLKPQNQITIVGGEPVVYSLKEPFRSERWKENVLRQQARRTTEVHLTKGSHTLEIKALDNHIVLDQWMIDFNLNRKHYLFPS